MQNKEKIKWLVELIGETNHKYGEYFFKKWKKGVKSNEFPLPLLYITAYSEDKFTEDFYYFVRDLQVDLGCDCGKQYFLDLLDESDMKLSSFKGLMTQLAIDYINVLMDEKVISSDELVGS
jgi:hypothetical protein